MRNILFIILLFGLSFANSPVFTQPAVSPDVAIVNQITFVLQIAVPLMFTMLVLAAGVYAIGQIFGSDIRAKASVWAQGMVVAVGVSAGILALLYVLLPGFLNGNFNDFSVVEKIIELKVIAENTFVVITITLLVLSAAIYAIGQTLGADSRARATVWATGMLGGAIFTAVIYFVIFQIFGQLETTFFSNTVIGLYGSILIQICLFVALFILITYLISKVFKVPEWEAYINVELSNLIGSFFIVLFVLGLFAAGSAIALVMTGGSFTSPPQAAISYMRGVVVDSALRATIDVYKIQACTSILSTFSKRIGEFVLTQTYKVFPGIDTFVSITNVLAASLLVLYNTASAQVSLLYLVDALMVPFFLPAGLILRFFPPTRDAGAFLISLAFGMQIIFPTTLMLNKQIYSDIHPNSSDSPYVSPTLLIQSLCGPFKYGVAGYLFNPAANPIFGVMPGGAVIGNTLSKFVGEALLNGISMSEFIPIMEHISSISLLALFMPALSMMITISFINTMTKFIVSKV